MFFPGGLAPLPGGQPWSLPRNASGGWGGGGIWCRWPKSRTVCESVTAVYQILLDIFWANIYQKKKKKHIKYLLHMWPLLPQFLKLLEPVVGLGRSNEEELSGSQVAAGWPSRRSMLFEDTALLRHWCLHEARVCGEGRPSLCHHESKLSILTVELWQFETGGGGTP